MNRLFVCFVNGDIEARVVYHTLKMQITNKQRKMYGHCILCHRIARLVLGSPNQGILYQLPIETTQSTIIFST